MGMFSSLKLPTTASIVGISSTLHVAIPKGGRRGEKLRSAAERPIMIVTTLIRQQRE